MGNGTINIQEVELIRFSDCLAMENKELRGVRIMSDIPLLS